MPIASASLQEARPCSFGANCAIFFQMLAIGRKNTSKAYCGITCIKLIKYALKGIRRYYLNAPAAMSTIVSIVLPRA
jgi:hypothetical protein